MDLSLLVQEAFPKATLTIYDNARYTPTLPAFLGGEAQFPVEQAGEGANQAALNQAELFARGFQLSRVNSFSNTSGFGSTYQVTPSARLQASYAYGFVQFGKSFVTQGAASAFESRAHFASVGPSVQVSSIDTVSLSYTFARGESDAAFSLYQSHGAFAECRRLLSPAFSFALT